MDATATLDLVGSSTTEQIWSAGKRLAFRLCFIYFTLFCLSSQIISSLLPIPKVDVPDLDTLWPFRAIIFWVGAHVFGTKLPLVYSGSGSGDKVYDWVTLFCIAIVSLAGTAIWSALDRKRQGYARLYGWFWLFIRLCLAGQMLVYGSMKAVPLQMPHPFLFTLTEPFGNFSPMGVLWNSIGASRSYEIFAGCAELAGAILLMFPRTAVLGALIALADMLEVFLLNMTYDVPVKLLSFNLILMALFLLGPNLQRLADFFLLQRPTASASPVALPLKSSRALRVAAIAQLVLCLWIVGNDMCDVWNNWHQYGPGRTKSPLYGIWDLDQFTLESQVKTPMLTDSNRARRIIFDFPGTAQLQQMDESIKTYNAEIDEKKNTLNLTRRDDQNWKASLTYLRSAPDHLQLDGTWGWPQGADATEARGRNEVPAQQPRLPLGAGLSLQPLMPSRDSVIQIAEIDHNRPGQIVRSSRIVTQTSNPACSRSDRIRPRREFPPTPPLPSRE